MTNDDLSQSLRLERVDAQSISPEEFLEMYSKPVRPVVFTGLFEDQPLAEVQTMQDAMARFGDFEFPFMEQTSSILVSLLSKFYRGEDIVTSHEREKVQFKEYLGNSKYDDVYIHAVRTPQFIRELYERPVFADESIFPWVDGSRVSDGSWNQVELTFVARAGRYTDLHVHGDIAQVLLHQVFGDKGVIVIPPEQSTKVHPLLSFSLWDLNEFDEKEQCDFVRWAQGYRDVLKPGETLYLPPTWWHYFDYVEHAMSVNFRFGAINDEDVSFLLNSSDDYRHKRIALEMRDPDVLERFRPRFQELREYFSSPFRSAHARQQYLSEASDRWYSELFPSEPARTHVELNDVLVSIVAETSPNLSRKRLVLADVLRRIGFKLAMLG